MKRRGQPRKKESIRKSLTRIFRCTEHQKAMLETRATQYVPGEKKGNVGEFIRHCIEHHERRDISEVKEDIRSKQIARVIFRCSTKEWNWVRVKARMYAGGNTSKWLRYIVQNHIGQVVTKKEGPAPRMQIRETGP